MIVLLPFFPTVSEASGLGLGRHDLCNGSALVPFLASQE